MVDARGMTGAELARVSWGVFGVVAILVDAIVRVLPLALAPLAGGELGFAGGLAYLLSVLALGYCEGYRGFARSFSPRVVARALATRQAGGWLALAAPLVAMGLMHATRRRLIASWCLVAMIVAFILMLRVLPQPWRGAVDAGVVVGLSWGVVATVASFIAALRGRPPTIEPDLP